jgi:hypothetical protein
LRCSPEPWWLDCSSPQAFRSGSSCRARAVLRIVGRRVAAMLRCLEDGDRGGDRELYMIVSRVDCVETSSSRNVPRLWRLRSSSRFHAAPTPKRHPLQDVGLGRRPTGPPVKAPAARAQQE